MQHESGEDYVRRLATYIRKHELGLAQYGSRRRHTSAPPSLLGWLGTSSAPVQSVVLNLDVHHLFYILMRIEALGIDVGSLDVRVDNPSRPMACVDLFDQTDKAETFSLASFRSSLSAVSSLSLGPGWWRQPPPVDIELKYIYSCFTKLPALKITPPGRRLISDIADDPPNQNAIPLDAFKSVKTLECNDIDPRSLLGWDRLAESLRSLTVRRSGVEDISDLFVGAVLDDQARRRGSASRRRRRRIPMMQFHAASSFITSLPDTPEDEAEESDAPSELPTSELPSLKWAFLQHLALPDNGLTFFPSDILPTLKSLTHLDLSSNLLVSIPSGLSALYNLVSLNLSDNMIDSVLGIYQLLGQVLTLSLAKNRLESICGLERLYALERVDVRDNIIEEITEISRLAVLPNITQVWIEGNPFVDYEPNYRIACFDFFRKEGKDILLDGTGPGLIEKMNLTVAPSAQMTSTRPVSVAQSPPTVAVGSASPMARAVLTPKSTGSPATIPATSPQTRPAVASPGRKKRHKRIVNLEGDASEGGSSGVGHARVHSEDLAPRRSRHRRKDKDRLSIPHPASHVTRHRKYQIDLPPSPPQSDEGDGATVGSAPRVKVSRAMTKTKARRLANRPTIEPSPPRDDNASALEHSADDYRRRIEMLKNDVGDGWLKVFSQSQLKADS
ncbi:hypothetical protein FISHEDRAFT_39825 [Fistulina hepatica ATCC 64428]|uniref:L domain-like protein n=1 Tax=Fistulina hepatica ATCC 64428 TaxID=1128425 RepID=A0A0D7AH71_9AGAR|nr:hypothetical protein FISHEDRAFT_39825 [Fistulina hepatica ATCC 64428]